MAAYNTFTVTLFGDDEPERVMVESVSPSYFSLLGMTPAHGRTFRNDEDVDANRDFVVVLGDSVWRQHFGADPAIVNKTIRMSGQTYTVIGIMPPGFTGITDTGRCGCRSCFRVHRQPGQPGISDTRAVEVRCVDR
jgi:hypothetical protein